MGQNFKIPPPPKTDAFFFFKGRKLNFDLSLSKVWTACTLYWLQTPLAALIGKTKVPAFPSGPSREDWILRGKRGAVQELNIHLEHLGPECIFHIDYTQIWSPVEVASLVQNMVSISAKNLGVDKLL